MEKKSAGKEMKCQDVLGVLVGVSILFSALTAVGGYAVLSISNAMVLAVFCVLNGMSEDLKDLCNGLAEEE